MHAYTNEICVIMHTLRTLLDIIRIVIRNMYANPHFISCGLRARLRNIRERREGLRSATRAMTFKSIVVVTDVKFRLFLFIRTWNSDISEFFAPQFSDKYYLYSCNDYVCKRYVEWLLVRLRENYVKRYAYWFLENISLFKMGNLLCEE